MTLEGRVAMVTGGAMGIGEAIVRRLAREGASIAVLDIRLDRLAPLAQELRRLGTVCETFDTDVTRSDQVREAVSRALSAFGRIDILVNNAGGSAGTVSRLGEFALDEGEWDKAYEVNLKSQFIVTSLVMPHMKERRYGKIVNVSSGSAKIGDAHRVGYAAAKAGVISFTRALARELGKYNINVNAVCPGLVWTPQWEREAAYLAANVPAYNGLTPKGIFERWVQRLTLLGKGQEPDDIASAIVFLASEDSRMMTGQSLNVDGGIAFD